jgi:hypothetical protein
MNEQLNQAVLNLHDIARLIENNIGHGKLSEDVRKCADRLHELLQPIKITEGQDVQS